MNDYTIDDIKEYEGYMQDVLDLNSYMQEKLNIYNQACINMVKAFEPVVKNKKKKDARVKCITQVEKIWKSSNDKIKSLVRTKPHNAGAAVDNFLDTKDKIGKATEVKKDEETFAKSIREYQKFFNSILDNWDTDGTERKKMVKIWNICTSKDNELSEDELKKIFAEYRKLDYLVDVIFGEVNQIHKDNKSILKVL